MQRAVRAAAVLLLVAAACTSSQEPPADRLDLGRATGATSAQPPTGSPSPATEAPADLAGIGGRLAVLDGTGRIVSIAPDGSDEVVLAEAEPGRSENRQPAWSADGTRLAWVHLEVTDEATLSASVATSTFDGRQPTETATEVVPFYLSWDPTSSRVGYLGPLGEEIEFGVIELAGRTTATPIGAGQPFYLSWAPGGDELLVHVGTDRLDRLRLDGSTTGVGDPPGSFSAPVWTADGRTLVYAAQGTLDDRLVVRHLREDASRAIVPYDGLILFVVSPDGSRIAYQVIGETETSPLSVIDLASGETTQVVDDGLVAAFYWSPDGERLLVLDPVPDEDAFWYRWLVWDGVSSFTTSRFVLSILFVRDYLPFFEQYAQSMSLWSPDGRAFAYPGMSEDGETGIWVQPARPDREPVLVADGEFVTWSPA